MKDDRNCYQVARISAGMTQERAAELLPISVESLKAYENGHRMPDNGMVARMADLYEAPWLALSHLKTFAAPLRVIPREACVQPLPTAAIRLLNRVTAFAEHRGAQRLLQIAEDGIIDEAELQEYEGIVAELDGLVAAALSVKYVPKQKKNRPDAGTSERRRTGACKPSRDKSIVSDFGGFASSNFARAGGDFLL